MARFVGTIKPGSACEEMILWGYAHGKERDSLLHPEQVEVPVVVTIRTRVGGGVEFTLDPDGGVFDPNGVDVAPRADSATLQQRIEDALFSLRSEAHNPHHNDWFTIQLANILEGRR